MYRCCYNPAMILSGFSSKSNLELNAAQPNDLKKTLIDNLASQNQLQSGLGKPK